MAFDLNIPEWLDVMALPGVTLFPGALLPLYIFEPRYREMVERALDSHRMFAVAQLQSNAEGEPVFGIGGAGLVRACVRNADGTSHLVLQGVARVSFQEWTADYACRRARIRVLESRPGDAEAAAEWQSEVHRLCLRLAAKNQDLRRVTETFHPECEAEEFSDLVASAIIVDPEVRQRLLEELEASRRLEMIARHLARLVEEK